MSAIEDYKTSDDFQDAVEQEASKYFGEGFDLCKKHISLLYPKLNIPDIQINPELFNEEEMEEKEEKEEKSYQDTNPLSP